MMECPNGGLELSFNHNSSFEISKLVVMDFARTTNDVATSPLIIEKPNSDGARAQHTISMIDNHKYLVVFDPKLS